MKTNTLFAFILAASLSSHAATLTDNFDRANVAYTNNGSQIGSDWVIGGSNTWSLTDNKIFINPANPAPGAVMADDSVMWNAGVNLVNGDFSVSTTVGSITGARRAGLAFFVQDASNFLSFDIQSNGTEWSIRQFENGVDSIITSGNTDTTFSPSGYYALTVASTGSNEYAIRIVDTSNSMTLVDTLFEDSAGSIKYTSGYGGLYYAFGGGSQYRWDEFSATSPIPESSSLALGMTALVLVGLVAKRRKRPLSA